MRFISFLILLLASSSLALAQVDITVTPCRVLTGITDSRQVGELLLIDKDAEIESAGAVFVTIKTEAKNVSARFTKFDATGRIPVFAERVSNTEFLVSAPGKVWLDVTVFDSEKNIFGSDMKEFEVPAAKGGGLGTPIDVDEPTAQLKTLIAPIAAKLKSDPEKSARVITAFHGFALGMRGKAGSRIKDVGTLGQVHSDALQDLDMATGVKIGAEIRSVLQEYVGIKSIDGLSENKSITPADRVKIAEVYDAIVWAGIN